MKMTLVFDLDDTLLDTHGLLIPVANTPAFLELISKPLPLLEGALENLTELSKSYSLFLLTQGRQNYQKLKIKNLGIDKFFTEISIVGGDLQTTKEDQFRDWIQKGSLHSGAFWSIGNRLTTDLIPAQRLGGKTCWFRHGEHQSEVPGNTFEIPHVQIYHHRELRGACQL